MHIKKHSFLSIVMHLCSALVFGLLLSVSSTALGEHVSHGTHYGVDGVSLYEAHQHGLDGRLLLDPFIETFLDESEGLSLVDIGCGAGPWAIYGARKGSQVTCVDIQAAMIDLARHKAQSMNLTTIRFDVADAAYLPYQQDQFQKAISVNVGCNLPSLDESHGFYAHFLEMHRVLEPQGRALVSAPASFDVLFMLEHTHDGLERIQKVLDSIPLRPTNTQVIQELNQLDFVLRATFKMEQDRLVLVQNLNQLSPGEKIWRKIPGLTVPNYYHDESEYLEAAQKAGFILSRLTHSKFEEPGQALEHGLNDSYASHPPFIVFEFEKPS